MRVWKQLGVTAVFGTVAFVSSAEELRRFHFKNPVAMRLDPTRVAVQSAAARGDVLEFPGYFRDPDAFQLPMPQWRLLASDEAALSNGDVARNVAMLAGLAQADFVSPVFLDDRGDPIVLTQDLLIGVREDIPVARAREIVSRFGVVVEEGIGTLPNGFKVRSGSRDGIEVLSQANQLALMDEIEFAEPDMIVTSREGLIPNDPFFLNCWGLHNVGQFFGSVPGVDLGAVEAWDTTTGSSAIITVVIDGGVQSSHPDLSGRVLTPGFDATGQGGAGEPVSACDNHGTRVAGCIVAKINNGVGVVGIAPNTRVASARARIPNFPCNGTGTLQFSWIANILSWAQSIGARVTNNSNNYSPTSSIVDAAYQSTYNAGIIHFASAMNDGIGTVAYPANLPVVNSVASLDFDGTRSFFSNWGPGLDFSAPGNQIATTDRTGTDGDDVSDYDYATGTSFASPYAAGVAALILSQRPWLTPPQVETIMQTTARDLGATGYDTDFGHGLVRADAALQVVNGRCPLTWEQRGASPGPSARVGYAMAYDAQRNEHVLFGGDNGSGPVGDTWAWNGSSWRFAASTGPSPRAHAVAVFDSARNRVVLFGGRSGNTYHNDTWEWNGSAWVLVSTANAPSQRAVAGMAFDSLRNRAVLFGGNGPSGHLGDLWEYDGTNWLAKPTPPVGAREWPGLAFDSVRGVLVLFGGSPPQASQSFNDTWEWNGVTGAWSLRDSGANGPPGRGNKNLAFDPVRGVTVVLSGYAGVFRPDHWEWNGSVWTQRHIAIPEARYSHVLTYDSLRNRLVSFGGEVASAALRDTTWEFDGSRWIPMSGTGPSPRFGAARAFVPELGGAVIFGGVTAFAQPFSPISDELWLQSPSGWGRLDSSGLSGRAYANLHSIGNGQLLLFGGLAGSDVGKNDLWRFSNGTWSQLSLAVRPHARWGAASCVFANGALAVFGGQFNGSPVVNDLWLTTASNPQGWLGYQFLPGDSPSARDYPMMAYDPIRDEAILFGGRNASGFDLDDIWRLRFVSGTPEWTQMGSLGSIQSWRGGSMFWDPGRQRILLYAKQQFGFDQNASVVPAVYEWTGTSFVPVAVEQPPSLRRFAAIGPTSNAGDIRLFGGLRTSDSAILGDTWAFNGVAEPSFPVPPSGAGSYERGTTVTLSLPVVIGQSPALSWKRDGSPLADGVTPAGSIISGSQSAALVISNVQPADAGLYMCFASNPCGSATSSAATVQVTVNCPSDFNGDLFVDDSDFVIFAEAYSLLDCTDPSMSPGCPADLNGDGFVDDPDFVMFATAYEQLLCP
jgi:hypothetical protein